MQYKDYLEKVNAASRLDKEAKYQEALEAFSVLIISEISDLDMQPCVHNRHWFLTGFARSKKPWQPLIKALLMSETGTGMKWQK